MNLIITGEVNIGKSTVAKAVLQKCRIVKIDCYGILSEAIYANGEKIGYQALDVRNGSKMLLAICDRVRLANNFPTGGVKTGRFSFSEDAIKFGIAALQAGVNKGLIFLDEVGPLELNHAGFYPAIKTISANHAGGLIVVVRSHLLTEVMELFHPLRFHIYPVNLANRSSLAETIFNKLQIPRTLLTNADA